MSCTGMYSPVNVYIRPDPLGAKSRENLTKGATSKDSNQPSQRDDLTTEFAVCTMGMAGNADFRR